MTITRTQAASLLAGSPTVAAHHDKHGRHMGRDAAERVANGHGTTVAELVADEGLTVTPGPSRPAGSATTYRSGYVRTVELFAALGY